MNPGITATDAASTYGTTPAAVHRLACHHKWNRTRINGRVYYDLAQVDAVLRRPHSTRRMRLLCARLDNV
jgi:hypothetical protein